MKCMVDIRLKPMNETAFVVNFSVDMPKEIRCDKELVSEWLVEPQGHRLAVRNGTSSEPSQIEMLMSEQGVDFLDSFDVLKITPDYKRD